MTMATRAEMTGKAPYEKPFVEITLFTDEDIVTMSGLWASQSGYGDSIDYLNLPKG